MFGKSMNQLLIGAAVAAGTGYVADTYYKDSFLETSFKDLGKSTGLSNFFSSPEGNVIKDVGTRFASATVKEMLGQGLGVDPRDVKTMPEIRIPERDTYRSDPLRKPARYQFPQGSRRIIDNALKDSVVENIAMEYTKTKMPKVLVVNPTIRVDGIKDLSALAKGQIQSIKS